MESIARNPRLLLPPAGAVVAALLLLASVLVALERVAAHYLEAEAERIAVHWADFVKRSVPDLDLIFEGEPVSALAQDHLTTLRSASDVFRFKLFGPDGRLVLVSDSLGTAPTVGDQERGEAEDVRAAVEDGAVHVRLRDGAAAGPAAYSEAYLPVRHGSQLLGVVKVYVDQAERAAGIRAAFGRVAAAVAAALLCAFALALWLWARRVRQDRANEQRMRYLAQHDALTGTLNRASFQAALEEAGERHRPGSPHHAVLCIDLDRFKEVNDTLGHPAGDELLRQAAQRLRDVVRDADLVSRLGGDEFAVLQCGVRDGADVATLAERIVKVLGAPYDLAGQRVVGSASVGAAIHGADGTLAEALMHSADLALYRAKANGRDGYSFYDSALDQQLQRRRALTQDLRTAIDDEKLTLHFQPLYAADGRTLRGYEALARWTHPERGPVPPVEFVPLAEETGLIDDLGRWVLRRACVEAARWPAPLSVAVNLSVAQFRQPGAVVHEVAHALAASGLPGERLAVEITESLLMGNTDQVLADLHALHGLGVRIAMDDFGTGYSSLAYLWRFPFDKVKIDRAFTQNMQEDGKVNLIVKSIVSLAHSLGIEVNAEGVETSPQMAILREHGCDELQGFLLGRPSPADTLTHGSVRIGRSAPARTDLAPLDSMPMPL